jgi:hypothetical protein
MQSAAAMIAFLSATPDPGLPDADLISPGPWGFAAIAFIGVAVVLLILDMMRRIRRARYRSEVQEELDAEEAARQDPEKPRAD